MPSRLARVLAPVALWLAAAGSVAADWGPAPEGLDAESVARRAEDQLRSSRTRFEARMIVESPRLPRPRVVAFRSWSDADGDRSFVRILEPAKDAGSGFLKLHPNLWMYIPRVQRTVRIPPSMMMQSWMGSDFTNDDLVRESSEIEDYEHRLLGVDPDFPGREGPEPLVLEYVPRPDTPVVWGRILAWIDPETWAPLRQEFFDEDGTRLRVMRFEDVRAVGERMVPHRWSMTPLDKEGHRTSIEIESIAFDVDIDDSVFTTRNLKRGLAAIR